MSTGLITGCLTGLGRALSDGKECAPAARRAGQAGGR